jgi:hypothetical protein
MSYGARNREVCLRSAHQFLFFRPNRKASFPVKLPPFPCLIKMHVQLFTVRELAHLTYQMLEEAAA